MAQFKHVVEAAKASGQNDVELFHLKALKLPIQFQSQSQSQWCVLLAAFRLPVVLQGAAHLQQGDSVCRVVNYPDINPIHSHLHMHMVNVHRDIPEGLHAVILETGFGSVDKFHP